MAVIHGDIKPDNILIFPAPNGDGVVAKICDFGFSSVSSLEDQDERRPLGLTRGWSAPEHDSGKASPAFAQDVYSLGLIAAYILLSGRQNLQQLIDQADSSPVRLVDEIRTCLSRYSDDIAGYPTDIKARVVTLVQKCLFPLPNHRPRNLESVRDFLRRADGQLGVRGTLHETVIPLPKSISRMVWIRIFSKFCVALLSSDN
jgi:serine/threonine protein kinase